MKLFFDKKEEGEIFVQIDSKDFSTKDYIEMIKEIRNKEKIDADYGEKITQDERDSVEAMLLDINGINEEDNESDASEQGSNGIAF